MSPSPPRTWRPPLTLWRHLLLRWGALAIVLAPALTGSPAVAGYACPVWALVCLVMVARSWAFGHHLQRLPRLEVNSRDGEDTTALPGVSIIAAARNEARAVEAAARSMATQDYPAFEAILVDDHSTDDTGAILDRIAPELPHLRVLHDPPLREGWLGKANAVWTAVAQANPTYPWLVLTDGDVWFHPKTLRRAIALAERRGIDFVTAVPYLDNATLGEELVLPIGWGGLIIESSIERMNRPQARAVGVGAFILVRRGAYLESGGHSADPGRQPEDAILASTLKRWGATVGLALAPDMLRVRLYPGLPESMRALVRKSRVNMDDRAFNVLGMIPLWCLGYATPLLTMAAAAYHLARGGWSWAFALYGLIGLTAYGAFVRLFLLHRTIARMRPLIAWVHPIVGLLRLWVQFVTLAQVLAGHPMTWRGRGFVHDRAD